MVHQTNVDHAFLAKVGFLLGFTLFVIGTGGELIGHGMYESLPAWEKTLLFDLEVVGLLVGFFSPILFGIFLPLIE